MGAMKFDSPSDRPLNEAGDDFTQAWTAFFTKVRNGIVLRTQAGTTAQRPTKGLEIGLPYYDTTLGMQICVHQVTPAVVWHNGAGVVV
jgi:hypothetical protein